MKVGERKGEGRERKRETQREGEKGGSILFLTVRVVSSEILTGPPLMVHLYVVGL